MSSRKKVTRTLKEVKNLIRLIAKKESVKLYFLKPNQGQGGYNYGGSGKDVIMLSPFVMAKKGEFVGKHEIYSDCDNPIECMLMTFFHELSHCKLTEKVPSYVTGYSWNDTSKFQFELWITMLGVEYAHSKYGIKFSDQTMRWMLQEAQGYIRESKDVKEPGYGLVCTKADEKSYTVVSQWDFRGK